MIAPVRHPATKTWTFAAPDLGLPGGIERLNLRELAARPDRLEHHLVVVARIGTAQLELATASEPLYFAHVNISDEYALPLPTGDPLLDAFPMRTFVSDATTGADVARYNHTCGDLVLHPLGYAHWPGKLRPPYQGLQIPPGMRRCGLSVVYCASVPTPSTAPIVPLPAARAGDVKAYVSPPPAISLAPVLGPADGERRTVVARVGETELALLEQPTEIVLPNGGWVIVLAVAPSATRVRVAPCDLLRVPSGRPLPAEITRALVLTGSIEPEPVPPSWHVHPPPPFPLFEDAERGPLPVVHGDLRIDEVSASTVAVTIGHTTADVPRYWLARMLFRIALHELRLNVVETYGGFYVDDSTPAIQIGLRIDARRTAISVPRDQALALIERLYRSVAPPDYRERLV